MVASNVNGVRAVILFVHDDIDVLSTYQRLAKTHGYDAELASTGQEALAIARLILPDVIVLDVHLADMDGLDVLRALRTDAETMCIPVLTVSEEPPPIDVDGYLATPCSMADVFRLVQITLVTSTARAPCSQVVVARSWDSFREG